MLGPPQKIAVGGDLQGQGPKVDKFDNNNNTNVAGPAADSKIFDIDHHTKRNSMVTAQVTAVETPVRRSYTAVNNSSGEPVPPSPSTIGRRNVNFKEFKKMKQESIKEERLKMAKEAFKLIDTDGNGYLTRVEVLRALKKMNSNGVNLIPATMETVTLMMNEVDTDGDGQINEEVGFSLQRQPT